MGNDPIKQFESEISEASPMNEADRGRQREEEELAEAKRNRAQAELDRWWQGQRDLEAEERRRHRELDPFNWGHWN
jgi:hypothetical protein